MLQGSFLIRLPTEIGRSARIAFWCSSGTESILLNWIKPIELMTNMINQIVLLTITYAPRILLVLLLMFLTWFVARFSASMVLRAGCQGKKGKTPSAAWKLFSKITFWVVILLISPFMLRSVGLNADGLWDIQVLVAQFFSNWPLWMLGSVLLIILIHLFQSAYQFIEGLLKSNNASTEGTAKLKG